jgi:hypothetical protein
LAKGSPSTAMRVSNPGMVGTREPA